MPALRRAFGLVVFFLLVVSSGCTSDSVPAGQCRYNADCDSPQVCVGTYCRAACLNDNDCPDNGLCARGLGGVYFCSARSAPRPCDDVLHPRWNLPGALPRRLRLPGD